MGAFFGRVIAVNVFSGQAIVRSDVHGKEFVISYEHCVEGILPFRGARVSFEVEEGSDGKPQIYGVETVLDRKI